MSVAPQLPPTDFAQLEALESRADREAAYNEQAIVRHRPPQGLRYSKGTATDAPQRSWHSLQAILRSDRNASAALPRKELTAAAILTSLALSSVVVTTVGLAASAREGLDLKRLDGPAAVLLAGGLGTVAFGLAAGLTFGRARRQVDRAVDVYNDSLGMRLGMLNGEGKYIPAGGVLLDEQGNVILAADEQPAGPAPAPPPAPGSAPEAEPAPATLEAEPAPERGAGDPAVPLAPAPEPAPVQRPTARAVVTLHPRATRPSGPEPAR